jgi:hypothetical protein
VGQFWKEKKNESDPDPCICRHSREQHRQIYPDDEGPRSSCLKCGCQEFESPLHDSVYESPMTAGTYSRYNPQTKRVEEEPITWKHDRKACRVCNGTVNTVRGES